MAAGADDGPVASALATARWEAGRHGESQGAQVARIELAALPGGAVAMRHSCHPGGPVLVYTRAEIEAFIGGAKDGDFDDLIAWPGRPGPARSGPRPHRG